MKIYVSGTFTAQKRLRVLAAKLWDLGHEITGSWLHETTKPPALTQDQWRRRLGEKDTAEVMASDCLVLDLFGDSTTGGRYTELGIALHPRDRKLIYTVGPRSKGCFPALADQHFNAWTGLLAHVAAAHKESRRITQRGKWNSSWNPATCAPCWASAATTTRRSCGCATRR